MKRNIELGGHKTRKEYLKVGTYCDCGRPATRLLAAQTICERCWTIDNQRSKAERGLRRKPEDTDSRRYLHWPQFAAAWA